MLALENDCRRSGNARWPHFPGEQRSEPSLDDLICAEWLFGDATVHLILDGITHEVYDNLRTLVGVGGCGDEPRLIQA